MKANRSLPGIGVCAIVAMATGLVSAQTLKVGDKAPPLTIEKWVKGGPVKSFEKGKCYVVEFWATWCGPCVQAMPHLSELSRAYREKGLTIIGCTSEDPNNSLDDVESMVSEKGNDMDYTVAWDKGHATTSAFMNAAGMRGIPCCFVIDQKGRIAYIGSPMFLDLILDPLTSGTWDAEKGANQIQRAGQTLAAINENLEGNPKKALEALKEFEQEFPKMAHVLANRKFAIHVAADDYDGAYQYASLKIEKAIQAKNAIDLNNIAWEIVDPFGKVKQKNADLALKAALKAVELGGGKNYLHLDTLARAYFVKGNVEKAIETQTKALELAPAQDKGEMEWPLEEYRNAKR